MSLLAVLTLVTPVVVMVLLNLWQSRRQSQPPKLDQAGVELHAIRRRFDVALFKSQLGRDAIDTRRRLDDELDNFDRKSL
jgi:hypothetical protein